MAINTIIVKPDVTVRCHEKNLKNKYIIWSYRKDRYFIPNNKEVENVLHCVLNCLDSGKNWRIDLQPTFLEDLIKMGFEGSVKVINIPIVTPLDCYFDYTWSCNLFCKYCYNRKENRKITMSKNSVQQVFQQLVENGIMRVHLAGGEPFSSREGVINYIQTAANYGIGCSINCNGTLLETGVCFEVFKAGIKTLTFSIDGYTEESNDYLRGEGCFKKVINSIKLAVQIKKETGSNTRIQLKAVWNFDTSMDQFEGLVILAITLKADVMQFHNPERCEYHSQGNYGQKKYIEGYYKRVIFIAELQKKYCNQILIWNVWNPIGTGCDNIGLPGGKGCIGGQELLAIQPNGDIHPCLMNRHCFGNLFNDWGGNLRKFLVESKNLKSFRDIVQAVCPECDNCDLYSRCRGGSKVRIKVEFGRMDGGVDPLCPKRFLKKKSSIKTSRLSVNEMNHFQTLATVHSL